MKLLLIQAGLGPGGAEKNVAMLAAHRAGLGDDVHVAAMTCPRNGTYFGFPDSVTLHVLEPEPSATGRRRSGLATLRRVRAIRRLIRQEAPDLIVSFLTKINVLTLLAAAGTGAPVIVSERNNMWAQNAHSLWRHAQARLMPSAAGIVMQTERARATLPPRARRKARVIPNPCAPIPGLVRSGSGGPVRLAGVGRLTPQKGFDLLLDAVAPLTRQWPNLSLSLHGEGDMRTDLEARRSALGLEQVVDMPGASERPGGWIETTDVLVCSSRFEGFPNVIAEALVHGIPVVSFDCDFGPRELIDDGVNGLLVPSGDVGALSAAMCRLVGSDECRSSMSSRAPDIRRRLAPGRVLAEWDSAITDAAGIERSGPSRTKSRALFGRHGRRDAA